MRIKVLVVEDDSIQQMVLCRNLAMLKNYQCEVVVVDNGEQAITLVKEQDFDLIFMDYGLPDIDGYITAQEIRKFKAKPIVWCSAYGDPKQVSAENFTWYAKLHKPYNIYELRKVIERRNHLLSFLATKPEYA